MPFLAFPGRCAGAERLTCRSDPLRRKPRRRAVWQAQLAALALARLSPLTEYISLAAGSTTILSTLAHIDRLVIVPNTTGAGAAVTLSDGTTAILTVPAAATHAIDPHPYTVHLGIRNTAAAGFKLVLGASVAAVVVGGFGTPTTA